MITTRTFWPLILEFLPFCYLIQHVILSTHGVRGDFLITIFKTATQVLQMFLTVSKQKLTPIPNAYRYQFLAKSDEETYLKCEVRILLQR